MLTMMRPMDRRSGFSLIELMLVVAIFGILTVLGFQNFNTWIQNTKTRSVAESLQNGLRLAQAEAVKRGRLVTFTLTNGNPGIDPVPDVNGKYWSIQANPLASDPSDSKRFIQGASLGAASENVVITASSATITFNAFGRLTGLAAAPSYSISNSKGDRPLTVQVGLGGRVRMCDPSKTLSSTNPDGC